MVVASVVETDKASLTARLLALLKEHAVVHRPVTLASGILSDVYIDCRQVYFWGEAQFLLGELFYRLMTELEVTHQRFKSCGGMAMGAIPLALALSNAAFKRGRELPGFAVRKEAKEHGTRALIEGAHAIQRGSHVLMVEDVVTTASSSIRAIEAVRDVGGCVDSLFCIIDRQAQGREALDKIGVRLYPLYTLLDLRT